MSGVSGVIKRSSARIATRRPSKLEEEVRRETTIKEGKRGKRKKIASDTDKIRNEDSQDSVVEVEVVMLKLNKKVAKFDSKELKIPEEVETTNNTEDMDVDDTPANEEVEDYDLSTVPSMDLVANMNTLHGGMKCFKKLIKGSEESQKRELRRHQETSQESPESESTAADDALCKGQAQFEELVKRLKSSKQQNEEEDSQEKFQDENVFDLKTKGQLMRSVFCDYDEKVRLYDIHSTKIRSASQSRLLRHFRRIRSDLKKVFEGTKASVRRDLFSTMDQSDRRNLEKLTVADPFSNSQSMDISEELQKFLFPEKVEFNQENYVDFIKLVLLPEALIRVYSSLNKISFEQSENEMKWGPRYDGPIDLPT